MNSEEVYKECQLPYEELVEYLLKKYGPATCDYYLNDVDYNIDHRISRLNEGIYCHHIDEDKANLLSEPRAAAKAPYEWQKKERLVYCNLLEHLILHLKIVILRQQQYKLRSKDDVLRAFSDLLNGVHFLCMRLSKYYLSNGKKIKKSERECYYAIADNYYDFIAIILGFFAYARGRIELDEREMNILQEGKRFSIEGKEVTMLGLSDNCHEIVVEDKEGEILEIPIIKLNMQKNAADELEILKRRLFVGSSSCINVDSALYHDLFNGGYKSDRIRTIVAGFAKDFHGCGHIEFAEYQLNKEEYGAASIDEYISHAFPSYCNGNVDLSDTEPHMWKGEIPQHVLEDDSLFFIVRIVASFTIKQGKEPFVRQYKYDYWNDYIPTSSFNRQGQSLTYDDENNCRVRRGIIKSTSDHYDKKTNQYISQYIDANRKCKPITIELTLTYDDLILFDDRYDISTLNYLDGCYFVPMDKRY